MVQKEDRKDRGGHGWERDGWKRRMWRTVAKLTPLVGHV